MITLVSVLLALSSQGAVPGASKGSTGSDITVSTGQDSRAASNSSILERCGDLELRITSEAAGGTGRDMPVTKLSLNRTALTIQSTALSEVLQRGDGLRKFVAFCGEAREEIRVRIYSVRKPSDRIIYSVGSFTVKAGGGTTFHGEEEVSPEDFWLG